MYREEAQLKQKRNQHPKVGVNSPTSCLLKALRMFRFCRFSFLPRARKCFEYLFKSFHYDCDSSRPLLFFFSFAPAPLMIMRCRSIYDCREHPHHFGPAYWTTESAGTPPSVISWLFLFAGGVGKTTAAENKEWTKTSVVMQNQPRSPYCSKW